jgi:hypothetical protein
MQHSESKAPLFSTGPQPTLHPYQASTVAEVDLLRRRDVLRHLLLGLLGFMALLYILYAALDPSRTALGLIGLPVELAILGVAYWLNQARTPLRVAGAGYLALLSLEAIIMVISVFAPGGTRLGALVLVSFFLMMTMAAGIVISPSAPIWFALLGTLLTTVLLLLVPHAPSLDTYLQQVGLPIAVAAPAMLQCMAALLMFYGMGSLRQAYQAIDHARELQEAYDQLAQQKTELEEDIAALQKVYTRGANGYLTARAHLEGRLLWPLGQSLNLLFERLGRTTLQGQRAAKLEEFMQQLAEAVERKRRGQSWSLPSTSGAAAERLVAALQLDARQGPGA